jgi:PhoH-like ATPase
VPDVRETISLPPRATEEPRSHVAIQTHHEAAAQAASAVAEPLDVIGGGLSSSQTIPTTDVDGPAALAEVMTGTVRTVPSAGRPDDDGVRTAYVIDTCVLLADPESLLKFADAEVVVPLVVVEELDEKKNRTDEIGAHARQAIRLLERLRINNGGTLSDPVDLPSGGCLRVESNHLDVPLPPFLEPGRPDHRILATALGVGGVLVTKDAALRLKAAQLGAETRDYDGDTVPAEARYDGVAEIELDRESAGRLHRDGWIDVPDDDLVTNQCVVVHGGGLARVAAQPRRLVRVNGTRGAFGVQPRDARQTLALDLLLDPEISCVSLMGMAGTGKTFLALAAGLEQVVEAGRYRRISVYRPLVAVGRQEVGFLPGDLDEKLAPWMAAVHDNLYALFRRDSSGAVNGHRSAQRAVTSLLDRDQLEMAAITYLRGRSITDEYVIIDEAQNLEVSTLKVILTRMGEGSKIVFCGDLSQIDNPYISPAGGVTTLVERLKGSRLFGHVTLAKGQRSALADLAAVSL